MSDAVEPAFESSRKSNAFEGRAELDSAWRMFRKSLVDLLKEGHRSDAETLAKLAPIAAEAAETLRRLTSDAEAAVNGSRRNRELLERDEAKLRKTLRRAARQGSPGAVRMLRSLDGGGPGAA